MPRAAPKRNDSRCHDAFAGSVTGKNDVLGQAEARYSAVAEALFRNEGGVQPPAGVDAASAAIVPVDLDGVCQIGVALAGERIEEFVLTALLFVALHASHLRRGLEGRHDGHLRHQYEAFVGDSDLRDDRERDEIEAHKRNGAAGLLPFDL